MKGQNRKGKGRILITGCSGFIGRHAVSYALKNGYGVVGLDIKDLGVSHPNLRFIRGSITDNKAVQRAAKGCDYVVHLAAATSLPDFQYNLYRDYGINVVGFLNVIEAARKNKCRKFVYASSSAVYLDEYSEESEIDIRKLRNHYGKSKLIDDAISDSYIDSGNLSAVGLRYFNIYGPGEEVKLRPSPVTQFIASKKKGDTITLFGDGKQAKDFIHIDDVIRITFKLMASRRSLGVYNVGTGIATSFLSVARMMKPKRILFVKNPYKSSYIYYLKADTKRLLKEIGGYKFISVKDGVSRLMKENGL